MDPLHQRPSIARTRLTLQVIGDLAREQRRTTLRARTIAVTLRSALDDFNAARETQLDPASRAVLRREWCERAARMIQDVRAHCLQTRSIIRRMQRDEQAPELTGSFAELEAVNEEAERAIDRAELLTRLALAG